MGNVIRNLPLPVLNGAGTAVDISTMAGDKTITVAGQFDGASITLEISNDGGTTYKPLCVLQTGQGPLNVMACAQWIRTNVSGRNGNTPWSGVNVDIAAPAAVCQFAAIPMPVGNGAGTPVNIATYGDFATIIVGGDFPGAGIQIQISEDGTDYVPLLQFSGSQGGARGKSFTANFIRAFVTNRGSTFTAVAAIGAVDTGSAGGDVPTPPFAITEIFIYARLTGSDATGNGSLTNPYRTFQRAIRDVPVIIPAGTTYRVDITGIGLETLPEEYQMPVFLAADGIGAFDFAQTYFHYFSPVNVQADPQLATGVTGITSIPAAGAVVTRPDPSTDLMRIATPAGGWTPGQLAGKFAVSAGAATQHCVIWDNDVNYIEVTKSGVAPTFPIQIMECSAHLQAPKVAADLHLGAVNILNSPISLLGIKVSSDGSDPGQFGNWGLQIAGDTTSSSLQLCDLPGAGIVSTVWTRVRASYLPELLFAMAPNLFVQSFIDQSFEVVAAGPRVTVWGCRGLDNLFRQTVIVGTTPLHYRDLFDNFRSGPVGLTQLQSVKILDTIAEFPEGEGAGLEDGIYFTGGQLTLMGVDVSRSAAGNGVAVHVYGPNSTADFRSVTGTNYDLGAKATDGGHIAVNDAGAVVPTDISGTSGSFQSGGMAIEATWPVVAYPVAGGNFLDVTNADTSDGSRVWVKSL